MQLFLKMYFFKKWAMKILLEFENQHSLRVCQETLHLHFLRYLSLYYNAHLCIYICVCVYIYVCVCVCVSSRSSYVTFLTFDNQGEGRSIILTGGYRSGLPAKRRKRKNYLRFMLNFITSRIKGLHQV